MAYQLFLDLIWLSMWASPIAGDDDGTDDQVCPCAESYAALCVLLSTAVSVTRMFVSR